MHFSQWLAAISLGTISGSVVTGLLFVGYEEGAVTVLKEQQTIIAAVFTVAIGLATYLHFRKESVSSRARRQQYAWARLAIDVNALSGYAEACMFVAHQYRGLLSESADPEDKPGPDMPTVDQDVIRHLAQAAADLEDQTGTQIKCLLLTYQIQHARLWSLIDRYRVPTIGSLSRVAVPHNAFTAMKDAARLDILAGRLFKAARGDWQFDSSDVTEQQILSHMDLHLGPVSSS